MAGDTCCKEGCEGKAVKRRMCNKHYLRWYKQTPKEERPKVLRQMDEATRFWAKVQRKGVPSCWPWLGGRAGSRGTFAFHGRTRKSAAVALLLSGENPQGGKQCALHRCDNPNCVNPRHLYWGSRADNAADAFARNRIPLGEERSTAKLTEAEVVQIRLRYAKGERGSDLAREYGISRPTLYQITSGKKWASAGGPITFKHSTKWAKEKKDTYVK